MSGPAPLERRRRRHAETVEEVLDVAAAIMAEEGVAGLSLGEVARRMQIRTPSLYTYVDSKNALYDALFLRGWTLLNEAMAEHPAAGGDPRAALLDGVCAFVRWAVEHAAYGQLMFWRPVPGYRPSEQAYAAAQRASDQLRANVTVLRQAGLLRGDVDIDEAGAALTVLVSGVISQQLANCPGEPFDGGTFTARLPELVAMYLAHYGARPTTQGGNHDHTSPPPRRSRPAADVPRGGTRGGTPAVRRVRGTAAGPS